MKRKLLIALGVVLSLLLFLIVGIAISNWMIQDRVPVKLLSNFSVYGDKHYAVATGTMTTEGERSAMPLQTSEIKCSSYDKQCVVAQAMITPGKYLYVMADSYPVIEWTDSHLVFSNEAACVTNTYTINWVSKSVTGIRVRNKTPKAGVDCSAILSDELRITLRDGLEVWGEEERRAYPAFIKTLRAIISTFGS